MTQMRIPLGIKPLPTLEGVFRLAACTSFRTRLATPLPHVQSHQLFDQPAGNDNLSPNESRLSSLIDGLDAYQLCFHWFVELHRGEQVSMIQFPGGLGLGYSSRKD
jgi:hypothetical protein